MQRFQHSKCDVMRHYVAHLSYDVDRVDDRLMDINYKRMVRDHFYDGYSVGGHAYAGGVNQLDDKLHGFWRKYDLLV